MAWERVEKVTGFGMGGDAPALTASLTALTASAPLDAISSATLIASSTTPWPFSCPSVSGTTRETRPNEDASEAEMCLPVRQSSIARDLPTARSNLAHTTKMPVSPSEVSVLRETRFREEEEREEEEEERRTSASHPHRAGCPS